MNYPIRYPILEFYLNQLYASDQPGLLTEQALWQDRVKEVGQSILNVGYVRRLKREIGGISKSDFRALASVCLGYVMETEESDWLLSMVKREWGRLRD